MPRLLIVEDEDALRLLYEEELADAGYEVTSTASADGALALLRRESWDLIVLDIRMPGKDGLEALGEILGEQHQVCIVINSAYSAYKDNFMSWAADAYVVKSSDLTELKTTIANLLAE